VADSEKATSSETTPVRLPNDQDVPCPSCGYNLRANTSGTCPECGVRLGLAVILVGSPTRSSIKGVLAYARICLIAAPVVAASLAFVTSLSQYLSGWALSGIVMEVAISGAVTLLGITALASLFVMRCIHLVVSVVFFGFVAFVFIVFIIREVLYAIRCAWPGLPLPTYPIMLGFGLVGVAGLIIEIICDRKSRRWTGLR